MLLVNRFLFELMGGLTPPLTGDLIVRVSQSGDDWVLREKYQYNSGVMTAGKTASLTHKAINIGFRLLSMQVNKVSVSDLNFRTIKKPDLI